MTDRTVGYNAWFGVPFDGHRHKDNSLVLFLLLNGFSPSECPPFQFLGGRAVDGLSSRRLPGRHARSDRRAPQWFVRVVVESLRIFVPEVTDLVHTDQSKFLCDSRSLSLESTRARLVAVSFLSFSSTERSV